MRSFILAVLCLLAAACGLAEATSGGDGLWEAPSVREAALKGLGRRRLAREVAEVVVNTFLEVRNDGFKEPEGTSGFNQRTGMMPMPDGCEEAQKDVHKCMFLGA